MSARARLRAWLDRRRRKHEPTYSRDELADLIAEVRRPNGFES
jgi:hypothetical protein